MDNYIYVEDWDQLENNSWKTVHFKLELGVVNENHNIELSTYEGHFNLIIGEVDVSLMLII